MTTAGPIRDSERALSKLRAMARISEGHFHSNEPYWLVRLPTRFEENQCLPIRPIPGQNPSQTGKATGRFSLCHSFVGRAELPSAATENCVAMIEPDWQTGMKLSKGRRRPTMPTIIAGAIIGVTSDLFPLVASIVALLALILLGYAVSPAAVGPISDTGRERDE